MLPIGIISDGRKSGCYDYLKLSADVEPLVIGMENAKNFTINILEVLPDKWYNLKENSTLIINGAGENPGKHLANQSLCVISCGLSSKDSVTYSSVEGDKTVVCILRSIFTVEGKEIIPQEFPVRASLSEGQGAFPLLASVTALLLSGVPKRTIEKLRF